MRIRLLACIAGGLLGVVAAYMVDDGLGFSPTVTMLACVGVGIALGYVVSLLVDVFAPSPGSHH